MTPAEILNGRDPTAGIVSVELEGSDAVRVYRRTRETVASERVEFHRWLVLEHEPAIELPDARYSELEGQGYRVLAELPSESRFIDARRRLQDAHIGHVAYPSAVKQYLVSSGRTLFKGMGFDDIRRMQFDIETEGLSPEPEESRIILIAVSDNSGLLDTIEGGEKEILERFVALVHERDPDVLEGHNVLAFDFPFLIRRAERLDVPLALGRDGSPVSRGPERSYPVGGMGRPFVPVHVVGRHVLDTFLLVQRFDWAKGELTSYGLKECARAFGFASESRPILPGAEIGAIYRRDPELVREYARQDAAETRQLAELVAPVEFFQTQMAPGNYGQVIATGTGERINSIIMRAYLAERRAIPLAQPSRAYAGAYTDVRLTGLVQHVVKADVESLYPSLMLTHRIAPATDTLGVFLPALAELTERRMEAKRRASQATDSHYWDGLQSSFKVLINSFYGYLGGPFYWNDYAAAARVTELGRELILSVCEDVDASGGKVIEVDTDGVYFSPPDHVTGEPAERDYVTRIGARLPDGIRLALDGRYARMLSLKTKNYVLEAYDGRLTFKGASLRSRAEERFGRRFLADAVARLMGADYAGVAALYLGVLDDIVNRRLPVTELARRERVTSKTFYSPQKKRSSAVAAGTAVGDYLHVYEKTDGTLGLTDDYAGDENVSYYVDKLYKFACRLEPAFGGEFGVYIRKPGPAGLPESAVQTALDLM